MGAPLKHWILRWRQQAGRATRSKALWVNREMAIGRNEARKTNCYGQRERSHTPPSSLSRSPLDRDVFQLNLTSKHTKVIYLFFSHHGGGTQTERGVEQWETTGHQESCGQNKRKRCCAWDQSRPMAVTKQIGFWSHWQVGHDNECESTPPCAWWYFNFICAPFSSSIHCPSLLMPQTLTVKI